MKVSHIWEYLPDEDKLMEHHMVGDEMTLCGKIPSWSSDSDEDVWFSDHDRPNDIIMCIRCVG